MSTYKMSHTFHSALSNAEMCVLCGYSLVAHSDKAICEVCNTETNCDFSPDYKSKVKILLCEDCALLEKEAEKAANERRAEQTAKSVQNINSPAAYFVSEVKSIKQINDEVSSDDTISNKPEEICKRVKAHINHLQSNIITLSNEVSTLRGKQDELQIYLNHKMKEISEEKQKELGLLDVKYKPTSAKAPKSIKKAPSTKGTSGSKAEKKQAEMECATKYNIPYEVLHIICMAMNLSPEDAAKYYLEKEKVASGNKKE